MGYIGNCKRCGEHIYCGETATGDPRAVGTEITGMPHFDRQNKCMGKGDTFRKVCARVEIDALH